MLGLETTSMSNDMAGKVMHWKHLVIILLKNFQIWKQKIKQKILLFLTSVDVESMEVR